MKRLTILVAVVILALAQIACVDTDVQDVPDRLNSVTEPVRDTINGAQGTCEDSGLCDGVEPDPGLAIREGVGHRDTIENVTDAVENANQALEDSQVGRAIEDLLGDALECVDDDGDGKSVVSCMSE